MKIISVFTILRIGSAICFFNKYLFSEAIMSGMVIVGGGQAGYTIANKLRLMGYQGGIKIVCAENSLPYQRPPLSKKFLLGEIPKDRLFFRTENFYKENKIVLKLGIKVNLIDRSTNRVRCSARCTP